MSALPGRVSAYIVQALACYDTPSQVAAYVKENFGLTLSRQRIEAWHPERLAGAKLGERWRTMFYETRRRYLAELDNIGIAWPASRLRMLERIVEQAEAMGNIALAMQVLEQAAREAGRLEGAASSR